MGVEDPYCLQQLQPLRQLQQLCCDGEMQLQLDGVPQRLVQDLYDALVVEPKMSSQQPCYGESCYLLVIVGRQRLGYLSENHDGGVPGGVHDDVNGDHGDLLNLEVSISLGHVRVGQLFVIGILDVITA